MKTFHLIGWLSVMTAVVGAAPVVAQSTPATGTTESSETRTIVSDDYQLIPRVSIFERQHNRPTTQIGGGGGKPPGPGIPQFAPSPVFVGVMHDADGTTIGILEVPSPTGPAKMLSVRVGDPIPFDGGQVGGFASDAIRISGGRLGDRVILLGNPIDNQPRRVSPLAPSRVW